MAWRRHGAGRAAVQERGVLNLAGRQRVDTPLEGRTAARRKRLRWLKVRLTWDFGLVISIPVALIAYGHFLFNPGMLHHWLASLPISAKFAFVMVFYTALLFTFRRAVVHTQAALDGLEEARSTLDAAIELQRLLAKVASRFTDQPAGRLEEEVQASLKKIGQTMPSSHLTLLTLSTDSNMVDQFQAWSNGEIDPLPPFRNWDVELPWLCNRLLSGESVSFSGLSSLPDQADGERKLFESLGVNSAVLCPLTHRGAGEGFLGLLNESADRTWDESELELLAGLLSSVIERSDTEEALRRSEARFQGIIQVASDAIISVDPEQKILIFNHGAETMFGYDDGEVIGRPFEILLPPGGGEAHRSYVAGFLRSNVTSRRMGRNGEIKGRRKNGEEFAAEATISKLETGEDSTVLTYIVRDVSERRKSEAERTKLESQLRQAQKMEAMGGLAGGIAHDFNNLLGAMMGNAELAMTRVGEDEKLKANLQRVLQAGYRAARLVKQILTFSRVNEAVRKPVQIARVVEEALALVQSSIPAMIQIRKTIDPEVGQVLSEETQVHQIVMNLCTNAYHAMGERGGVLSVALERVEVDAAFASSYAGMESGTYVRLSVEDTGCGMDEATKNRIFEPFFTTKPVGKGTGMGLSVIHGIVMNHGGQIEIESEQGKGTRITVYLPASSTAEAADEALGNQHASPGEGSERILLVDDEASLIQTTQEILEQLGYQVTAISDSLQAIERFREKPDDYDVVITDYAMPNLSGLDMAKQMMALRPELPIIIATGYSESVTPESALELGLKAYVSKPYMVQDLTRALKQALADPAAGD